MPQVIRSPKVLVAPLNWGLGHATRCIPIIYELQALRCEVILASDGASQALLVQEFPHLTHLNSPHTSIRYSKSRWLFAWAMVQLIPRLWRQIKSEQQWIRSVVETYQIDAIISDNRYGLAHPTVPSVIITHQLGVRTGWGSYADRVVQRLLYRFIHHFRAVWVPDKKEEPSLAGLLSHPMHLPSIPVQYLGMLNRLAAKSASPPHAAPSLLVLLSGPEPQRTLLEKIIYREAASYNGQLIIIRGLPSPPASRSAFLSASSNASPIAETQKSRQISGSSYLQELSEVYGHPKIRILDHVSTATLQSLLATAEFIICRSGYTSMMELIPLQKKLILIPTPGQPEQIYLAAHANKLQWAPVISQEKFSLGDALYQARNYPYRFTENPEPVQWPTVLRNWILQIQESLDHSP